MTEDSYRLLQNGKHWLLINNYLSKYPFLHEVMSLGAPTVIALLKEICAIEGALTEVRIHIHNILSPASPVKWLHRALNLGPQDYTS